jgi:hypothetical protein
VPTLSQKRNKKAQKEAAFFKKAAQKLFLNGACDAETARLTLPFKRGGR